MRNSVPNVRRRFAELWLVGLALIFSACANDSTDVGVRGYDPREMFGPPSAELSPGTIDCGGSNTLTWTIRPRYTGNGHALVVGHGGGQPIGTVVAPVTAELGEVVLPVEFEANQPKRIEIALQVACEFSHIGVSFEALYDSIVVAGDMVPIHSLEAYSVFGGQPFPSTYYHLTMDAPQ